MIQEKNQSGFTLIEVLIAMVIVVMAMATFLRSFAQVIDSTATLRDRHVALWVAQNKLTQYQLEEHWPATGTRSDTTVMANKEWRIQEKVSATQIPNVRRVELDISVRGEDYSHAHLVGLVIKPDEKVAP